MKQTRKLMLALALVAMIAALLPRPSQGRSSTPGAAAQTQYDSATPPSQESWVGAGAAIGCGFGIRASRVTGNPWVVAGTLVLCLIMIVDGLTTHS